MGNNDCCNNSFYAPNEMETKDQSGNRREWGREKDKKEKEQEGEGGRWEDKKEVERKRGKIRGERRERRGWEKSSDKYMRSARLLGGPETPSV